MPLARSLAWPPASASFDALGLRVEMNPGDPAIAEISGEMDIASAAWLRDALLLAIRRHGPAICVDLHGVTFLDCSGIGVLLATARRARLEGAVRGRLGFVAEVAGMCGTAGVSRRGCRPG
jgi:anti-sigma B factor antagonist